MTPTSSTARHPSMDRKLVSMQPHERAYLAWLHGTTTEAIDEVIREVGSDSRQRIEEALDQRFEHRGRKAPARGAADALALLVAQHRDVKAMFTMYQQLVDEEADAERRGALAREICTALTIHATIEEEIFYPAARTALDDDDLLDEATVEHASAKSLIAQIEGMQPDDGLFDAKVKVLGEYIDHHVQEEEGEMFKKAKRAGMDLDRLGAELAQRTLQLVEETGYADAVRADQA